MVTFPHEVCEMFLIDNSEQKILNVNQCPVDSCCDVIYSTFDSFFVFCLTAMLTFSPLLRVPAALRPVDSELCVDLPPTTTQLCHISCPIECEVSGWSAWGPCTYENCRDQSTKKGEERTPQTTRIVLADRTRCSGMRQKQVQQKENMLQSQKLSKGKNNLTKQVRGKKGAKERSCSRVTN